MSKTSRFLGTVTLAAGYSFGVSGAGAEAAQDPTLDAVLWRAAAYVATYQRDSSGMVADERYVQSVEGGRTQRMESELFGFSPQDDARWLIFRDVIEVDGKPVEDRAQRFEELFRETRNIPAQLELELRDESARFNIGFIRRDLNVRRWPCSCSPMSINHGCHWRKWGNDVWTASTRGRSAFGRSNRLP